jgi:hypothetical protein
LEGFSPQGRSDSGALESPARRGTPNKLEAFIIRQSTDELRYAKLAAEID